MGITNLLENIMEINLTVKNIKCGGCVSNIKNALNEMSNVENIEVSIEGGKVKIYGDDLDQSDISKKLSELGYPVI